MLKKLPESPIPVPLVLKKTSKNPKFLPVVLNRFEKALKKNLQKHKSFQRFSKGSEGFKKNIKPSKKPKCLPVALNGFEEAVRRVPHGREGGAPSEVLGPVGVGNVGDEAGGGGERAGARHSAEVGVVGGVGFRVLGVVPVKG